MPQLTQGLCLDLANSLARNVEVLAHLFERAICTLANPESHAQDTCLAGSQRRQ